MPPSQLVDALIWAFLHAILALAGLFGYYGMAGAKTVWHEMAAFLGAAIAGLVFSLIVQINSSGSLSAPAIALICYGSTLAVLLAAAPRIIKKNRQTNISSLFRLTLYAAILVALGKTADVQFVWNITIWIQVLTIAFYFLAASDRLREPSIRMTAFAVCSVFFLMLFPITQMTASIVKLYGDLFATWQSLLFKNPGNSLMSCAAFIGTVVAGNNFMHMQHRLKQAAEARRGLIETLESKVSAYGGMAKELLMRDGDWNVDAKTTYLNHGSFGPPLIGVRHVQMDWQTRCNRQPMDFFVRQLEPAWMAARERLAEFVGSPQGNLVFTENATAGMNHVAGFFPLNPGDEVLLNDHEYGVVKKIWQRRCRETQAVYREMILPMPISSAQDIIAAIESEITDRTRLIVVSHITSPTAITLPVQAIIAMAKKRGIAVCVDGPHAPLQIPLNISELDCDFYLGSCHKWLCAPFGTGFTYVADRWHSVAARPLGISWGRLPPTPLEHWTDHHLWCGTKDYSGYLSIPTAIKLFEQKGFDKVRRRNHELAKFARTSLIEELGTTSLVPDDPAWYSMMAAVWLPEGDHADLQRRLWNNHQIEVPIVHFANRYLVRVSCHLYNTEIDIDKLVTALKQEISPKT
jgi:isopenicillin-N epimerase